jgi:tryptophan synthase alpha chain
VKSLCDAFRPGHKVLIGYLTVGFPDIETTLRAAGVLAAHGCDVIELGIPFSDPLADGATIQRASHEAIQKGITPDICVEMAGKISQAVDIPLVFMTYLNPVLSYGCSNFVRGCRRAGVGGLIVPDLPPDEQGDLTAAAAGGGLDIIYLLAPNSPGARVNLIATKSRGFIYLVSLTGTTGAGSFVVEELERFAKRVKMATRTPLCVGFGILTPAQAQQAGRLADGVIIGSRIIQIVEEDPSLVSLGRFIEDVRQSLDSNPV